MRNKRRVGIGLKITSGYIILIISLIISAVVLNNQITSLQKSRNDIIQYDSGMRTMSNTLERQIVNMESMLGRAVITGDDSYLQRFSEDISTWETKYNELEALVNDNSDSQNQLNTIKSEIITYINTVAEPLNDAILSNDEAQINAIISSEYNSTAIRSIQEKFTAFRNHETLAIQDMITTLNERNSQLTYGLFASMGVLVLITIGIFTIISRRISSSINEVTNAISEMDTDSTNIHNQLVAKTNDEVRDLVEATNSLLTSMQKKQWFQSNLAEIVTTYQGADTLQKLGDELLSTLTERTNAVYGSLYIQDQQNTKIYNKISVFAESHDDVNAPFIEVGKGYIGQSILEKRILSYERDQDAHHYLETSYSKIPITNGIVIPILFGKEVIAVMELASLNPFSSQHKALIKEVIVHLGVKINSILGRMEIIRLLNESQAMTEELQVQSEELQTQSEELKMQTEELTTINERLEERTREAEQKSVELQKAQIELRKTANRLRQSSNYKSEFLANMSHELRTPLNSILILSEMLAENAGHNLSKEELEYAQVIHNSGKDLLNLINDILDLSKVEAGKMDLWFSITDLYTIPQHVKGLFAPVARQKNLELDVNVDANVTPVFHTDIKRFHQIINNLLSNALKFTEKGSVQVNVEQPELTPEMKSISDTWVKVNVKDTGIGIPKDKQELVFESFLQADGATVRKFGGTGLGLSICREFSKLLGGWITLESEEGVGSTFTLYLPSLPEGNAAIVEEIKAKEALPYEVEEPAEKPAVQDKTIFNGKHILIVDDDDRNIYALRQSLEHKGVKVLTASNGAECIEFLKSDASSIDAVLMDIMMPEMDGYETMEIIRNELQIQHLPIIALTAKAMKQDRERAFEAGASDYISKPLNLDQLFSLLTVWLTDKDRIANG